MKLIKLADTKASEDKLAKLRELKLDEAWKLGEALKKNNTINLFMRECHKISAFSPVLGEKYMEKSDV